MPPRNEASQLAAAVHRGPTVHRWTMPASALPLDGSPGSPWLMIPPSARIAFNALLDAGTPLAASRFHAPLLGVKCGCNDAFVVVQARDGPMPRRRGRPRAPTVTRGTPSLDDDPLVRVRAAGRDAGTRHGVVERAMLRPLVRGETLDRWRAVAAEWILWTHERTMARHAEPLAELPPQTAAWLAPWRHRLAARTDLRASDHWWRLFRTESTSAIGPRVVWSDFGRAPRAMVLPAGDPTVALNTCYVARAPDLTDAHTLAALLNGPISTAWLNVVAEPAQGGYRRYMGWTVALLPLPRNWARARKSLAPLAVRAIAGERVTAAELTAAALVAYGLTLKTIKPLLSWAAS
jgi:hypothetical protein